MSTIYFFSCAAPYSLTDDIYPPEPGFSSPGHAAPNDFVVGLKS